MASDDDGQTAQDVAALRARIAVLEARLAQQAAADAERVTRQRSEEQLHMMAVEVAEAGFWELDLADRSVSWSPRARELMGIAPDAPEDYDTSMARVHPDDRERIARRADGLAAGDLDQHQGRSEFRFVHDDGREVWVEARSRINIETMPDGTQRPPRLFGVMIDVTERKQVERRLRESERQLATLLGNLPGMAYRCLNDIDWNMLFVSDGCRELCGYDADALVSGPTSFGELIYEADRERVWDVVQAALERRELFTLEYRIRHADGTLRWVWEQGQGVFDETSEALVALEGFISDVTARRRAEDALRAADRQKDEFLAMLGHELRNPLGIIRAASHALGLTSHADDPMLQQTQAVLERQTAHMARLIDGLLDVSRIVRGKLHLERTTLDLAQVVAEVVDDHLTMLGGVAARERLRLELRGAPLWVEGDRVRLAQVIDNLLSNAVRATALPLRDGAIEVALDRDADQVVLRLRDTGVGIAPEMLERIFEPFQQAPQPLARSAGGLGLGLALVRGIVELHGGRIVAHSEGPGRGAEFVVRLDASAPPVAAPPLAGDTPPAAARRHWRILLVEDNDDAARLLGQMLTAAGHEVRCAHNGHDALQIAHTLHPEAILCDLGLPGLSGYEVAAAVRASAALRDTLLIAVTGYGHDEARQLSQQAGFHAHLNKPVDLDTVEATLSALWLRRGS